LLEKATERGELAGQILDVIVSEAKIDRTKITPEATLESLEVQSMDVVMILMAIEQKYGVYIPIDGGIADATDVASFVENVAERILTSRG
jgi:acyl carrier protein